MINAPLIRINTNCIEVKHKAAQKTPIASGLGWLPKNNTVHFLLPSSECVNGKGLGCTSEALEVNFASGWIVHYNLIHWRP